MMGRDELVLIGEEICNQLTTGANKESFKNLPNGNDRDEMCVDAALKLVIIYGNDDIEIGESILKELIALKVSVLSLMNDIEKKKFAETASLAEIHFEYNGRTTQEVIDDVQQELEVYIEQLKSIDWRGRLKKLKQICGGLYGL